MITAIIHIFITSGSGLSVAMMPILGPLGQIVGLTAQTTVLAFQIGGSALNMITPTLALLWQCVVCPEYHSVNGLNLVFR